MPENEPLTPEFFAQYLNQTFTVVVDEATTITLALTEVTLSKFDSPRPVPHRNSFSLYFLGPTRPILPQRIYRFSNPCLDSMEIFIVPIASSAEGTQYEAVFN